MKKIYCILIIMLLCFTLFGCKSQPFSDDPSTSTSSHPSASASNDPTTNPTIGQDVYPTITIVDDQQYLVLPISKKNIRIDEKEANYIDALDANMLKVAEEKINSEADKYSESCYIYLSLNDGKLYLKAEIIAKIDPPLAEDTAGCGIDHEHIFFSEPIMP